MAQKKVRKGKKKWFPIQAPKIFENQVVGETFIYESEQLPAKHITVNLMALTGNPKKQNMSVHFAVSGVKEGVASTRTLGIEMQQSSMRRLVRRGRSKIADSFLARTKSGQVVRIKPIIVTRTRADGDTQRALRKRSRTLLAEFIGKYPFDTVINEVVHMRLQKFLKDELSAVYPVRSVDIRELRHARVANQEEADIEEAQYAERPKRERVAKEAPAEGLASLREEVEEALAAEKAEADKPKRKKAVKAAVEPDEEE